MLEVQTQNRPIPDSRAARFLTDLIGRADIQINGSRPWDIQIHDPRWFQRVLSQGSLGLGESYMDGWWDCEQLDEMFSKGLAAHLEDLLPRNISLVLSVVKSNLLNRQNKTDSKTVARKHYDLGNGFYRDMLDPRMQYTCAYWKGADTLEQAQENKLDLICRKLSVRPGMKILELGCGWGGFARFAAERYGCEVTALNISEQQVAYARANTQGLPVNIQLKDYRDAEGLYDRVVSVGLCEHIGPKNYETFLKIIHQSLKEEGMALVHTIGGNASVHDLDPWLDKYIFPNAVLPSIRQLSQAMEKLFVVEDWHNFGVDYDKTLMAWHARFTAHWPRHQNEFDARFYRMWNYYLLNCAGSFRARKNQLWQIVLSKHGVPGGYTSIR